MFLPTCQKCGGQALHAARLFGGVHATLCTDHVNEIDELLVNQPLWQEVMEVDADINSVTLTMAGGLTDRKEGRDRLERINKRKLELEASGRKIVKAWLAQDCKEENTDAAVCS